MTETSLENEIPAGTTDTPPVPPTHTEHSEAWLWGRAGIILLGAVLIGLLWVAVNQTRQKSGQGQAVFSVTVRRNNPELVNLRAKLDQAKSFNDTDEMRTLLAQIYILDPYDEASAIELADLYYQQGIALRDEGEFEAAQHAFNQALSIEETMETAQLEQQQVATYLSGVAHFQAARWDKAITALDEIYTHNPDYPHMREILYSAYFNYGIMLESQNDLDGAVDAYIQATKILPNMTHASDKIIDVTILMNPPTPTVAPIAINPHEPTPMPGGEKRVVVDVSEQHAYIYQGAHLIDDFVISTGKPGNDTRLGEFKIQSKIETAYASTWNLDMPYWLGIYYSGPLENGFHAVPTVRHTGERMWDGYLGQRVSYGCVILSMADAERLYNWVDIGTQVKIQW